MNFKGIKCPKCGRKGLHHPDHTHAYGWKEYSKAVCRFCNARFNVRESAPNNRVHSDAGDSAASTSISNASAESTSQEETKPAQRGLRKPFGGLPKEKIMPRKTAENRMKKLLKDFPVWQIGKLEISPDDFLVVRFRNRIPEAALVRVTDEIKKHTGLTKVLVFDEEVDLLTITPPNNACTGLAPTASQDGTGEAGASQ